MLLPTILIIYRLLTDIVSLNFHHQMDNVDKNVLHLVRLHIWQQFEKHGDITDRFFCVEGQIFIGAYADRDTCYTALDAKQTDDYYPKIICHPPVDDDPCCQILCVLPSMPFFFYYEPCQLRFIQPNDIKTQFLTFCMVELRKRTTGEIRYRIPGDIKNLIWKYLQHQHNIGFVQRR